VTVSLNEPHKYHTEVAVH